MCRKAQMFVWLLCSSKVWTACVLISVTTMVSPVRRHCHLLRHTYDSRFKRATAYVLLPSDGFRNLISQR